MSKIRFVSTGHEFAPCFIEGVKIRYPEYCRELPPARKQAEPAQ